MNPKKRQEALEYIQDSKRTRVILISFKAGGTGKFARVVSLVSLGLIYVIRLGLNLTMCNNVILMDLWWNPALEASCT
jgi:SNF2 family DNA or RNA helicase